MTAIYMTRMMIYTFHGPNRTGEKEREHLHEAPWIMTGPLVVLGVLTVVGGWFNIPAFANFLGPVGALEHWLEPVVGEATERTIAGAPELPHGLELGLVGARGRSSRVGGIALAWTRLKPERSFRRAQSPQEEGFEKVLAQQVLRGRDLRRGDRRAGRRRCRAACSGAASTRA